MTRRTTCTGLLFALLAAPAFADGFAPHEAVIRIVPGASIDDINADLGTTVIDSIPRERTYLLHVPDGLNEEQFEEMLEHDPRIQSAELNDEAGTPGGQTQSFYLGVAPAAFDEQYTWNTVVPGGISGSSNGAGVIVAIIDTGIDATHPIFAGHTILQGVDLLDNDDLPDDTADGIDNDDDSFIDEMHGHGTFQSALIAQLAPGATLLPIRALDSDGQGSAFTIAKAIYAAIDGGADVINMSLAMSYRNEIIEHAIEHATRDGILVVASAGNRGGDRKLYPAGFSDVIAVASTDADDVLSSFSCYGSHIDLCAPGSALVSAVPAGAFGQSDGTSGAAALVSATAAVMKSANTHLSRSALKQRLLHSCVDISAHNQSIAQKIGAGRLDLTTSLDTAIGNGDINLDGVTNYDDLTLLLYAWGSDDEAADVNLDGVVGYTDLMLLLAHIH
ncbi:MAG: S8 family serine peptidase [Phycisphaerales bacterium]|nr:S8 family serine peptidase [Phycisphaerales bacterium]